MSKILVARVAYRSFLALLAQADGADPEAVAACNPNVPRPGDRAWASAMRLKRAAVYLAVTELDLPVTVVALAAGTSKQAVSLWLGRIETDRDDPELDRLLERLGGYVTGRASWAA